MQWQMLPRSDAVCYREALVGFFSLSPNFVLQLSQAFQNAAKLAGDETTQYS
jgi:hypothetical protein